MLDELNMMLVNTTKPLPPTFVSCNTKTSHTIDFIAIPRDVYTNTNMCVRAMVFTKQARKLQAVRSRQILDHKPVVLLMNVTMSHVHCKPADKLDRLLYNTFSSDGCRSSDVCHDVAWHHLQHVCDDINGCQGVQREEGDDRSRQISDQHSQPFVLCLFL